MALRNCDANHCSGADAELNEICKQEGWAIGHPVITRDAQGPCQCHCSCLALGTPVAVAEGRAKPIQELSIGDTVLAAGADLKWRETRVVFSNGSTSGTQPFSVFVEYEGGDLIVTADHLFLLASGKLCRADRLAPDAQLVSSTGKPVGIKSVNLGTYVGGFHHIATSTADPKGDLSDHLILTNGVVSADYAVQLFIHDPKSVTSRTFGDALETTRPIVGSAEYIRIHGSSSEARLGRRTSQGASVMSALPKRSDSGAFVPASNLRLRIPKDAVPFVSEEEAQEIARRTRLRPFTDPHSKEWTEYAVQHHKAFYPDIEFNVDWYDDTINAYAWIENGKRRVAILGGLVRHPSLEIEGISLVLAHEIGHHYGGPPFYGSTNLSCEGQADFAAVRNIMRKVWFGEYYLTMATRGITQMAGFFGVTEPGNNNGPGGCSHPPGLCRIHTYNAALNLSGKPSCAG